MRFTLASLIFTLAYAPVVFASLRQANVYWERALELASYTAFATAILISIRGHRHAHYLAFGLFGFILTFGPHVPLEQIDSLAAAMKIGRSRSMFLYSIVESHVSVIGATLALLGTLTFPALPSRIVETKSPTRPLVGFVTAFIAYLAVAYYSCRRPNLYWAMGLEFGAYASYGAAAVIGISRQERGLAFIAYALFGFVFHFGPIVPYWIVDGVAYLFGHEAFTAWDDLRVIVGALFGVASGGLALLATVAVSTIIERRPESRP